MIVRGIAFALAILVGGSAFAAPKCDVPNIKQGMNYLTARKIVIDKGFQAPLAPAYGYGENDEKVISDCFGSVAICNKFPEIEGCSGSGHCRMQFTDAYLNRFFVFTYGECCKDSFEIECP